MAARIHNNESEYTPEIGDRICSEIISGKSLNSVLAMEGMPAKRTVMYWLRAHPEFKEIYRIAQQERAEFYVEEVVDIADDSSRDYVEDGEGRLRVDKEHINRSRLRVDTRKWIAAKMYPRLYGDKVGVEHSVGDGVAELLSAIDGRTRGIPSGG